MNSKVIGLYTPLIHKIKINQEHWRPKCQLLPALYCSITMWMSLTKCFALTLKVKVKTIVSIQERKNASGYTLTEVRSIDLNFIWIFNRASPTTMTNEHGFVRLAFNSPNPSHPKLFDKTTVKSWSYHSIYFIHRYTCIALWAHSLCMYLIFV